MSTEDIKNDIVKFIYNETSLDEGVKIADELDSNFLHEFFDDVVETKNILDKLEFSPPENVINRILQFSKDHNIRTTH